MRKWWGTSVLVILLIIVLAGCSATNETSDDQSDQSAKPNEVSASDNKEAEKSPDKEQVTIRFSFWGDDARKVLLEGIITKFNEKYPHIKVETLMIPNNEYKQKLGIMSASRTAPDVSWMSQSYIAEFIEGNQLLDLTSLRTDAEFSFDDIFPSSLSVYEKDGKLFGIPFSSAPRPIFFNKTLFEEKGIPTPLEQAKAGKWTYAEFLETAQKMTNPDEGVYGASMIVSLGWKAWQQSYNDIFWSFGAELLNEEGTKFTLNTPEGEKALQFISDMIFKHQVHPKPGDQIAFAFETGKLAMSRQDYSYVNNARKITNFEWDIAPMPTGDVQAPSGVGVSGYAIFKETKHPEEALAFLKFMTGKEGTQLIAGQFVAPRQSFLESDAFQKSSATPSPEGINYALIEQFKKGVKREYNHKSWSEIDQKMQILLDALYLKEDPKSVLNKMESEIDPLLK